MNGGHGLCSLLFAPQILDPFRIRFGATKFGVTRSATSQNQVRLRSCIMHVAFDEPANEILAIRFNEFDKFNKFHLIEF